MTDLPPLTIDAGQLALVLRLLREQLPPGARVWAFGSRVAGKVKAYSDLDLLIDAGRRLSLNESAGLGEAFSESDLPWKVDLVDRHAIEESFWRLIDAACVALPLDP